VQELGGIIARQLAQADQWKYSIPWTLCSVYEWGLAEGQESFLSHFPWVLNPLFSRSSNFSRSSVFFRSSVNFAKFASLAFFDRCSGADYESVVRR